MLGMGALLGTFGTSVLVNWLQLMTTLFGRTRLNVYAAPFVYGGLTIVRTMSG